MQKRTCEKKYRIKKCCRWICSLWAVVLLASVSISMNSCTPKETIIIYTSAEDYRVAYMNERLWEEFPEYNIIIEYMPTGNHAAKLLAEGKNTVCDITYDLEYTYLAQLENEGLLADLSGYDFSVFEEDTVKSSYYMPEYRNGGAIVINPSVLSAKGLDVPTCYDDLLKPEYKGLISMPNPASSGTGYMFLLAMVNERGEEEAFAYFDRLAENVLQFTSSGSGPVNALIQGEVAIGLGITGTAVKAINDGAELEIIFFEEGSPYALYGLGIVNGKETNPAVKAVFDFLYGTYGYENCEKFFPEPIYRDRTFAVSNYPENIQYCDMNGDTPQTKAKLLEKWKY